MEIKKITESQKRLLDAPLPAEAVKPHPTKTFLSSIKSIYVTERLNDVFGVGSWQIGSEVVDKADGGMIVVKVTFRVPEYGILYECYGGNNNGGEGSKNFDLGDAYKGAVTDAISKVGSWLGIGADIFKGKAPQPTQSKRPASDPAQTPPPAPAAEKKPLLMEHLSDDLICDQVMRWVYKAHSESPNPSKFNATIWLQERRVVTNEVMAIFNEKYNMFYNKTQKQA